MQRQFFDPDPEAQNVVMVDVAILREAEKLLEGCEICHPRKAEVSFSWVLDQLTGADPATTDYLLEESAICPTCCREILEETLVEPSGRNYLPCDSLEERSNEHDA